MTTVHSNICKGTAVYKSGRKIYRKVFYPCNKDGVERSNEVNQLLSAALKQNRGSKFRRSKLWRLYADRGDRAKRYKPLNRSDIRMNLRRGIAESKLSLVRFSGRRNVAILPLKSAHICTKGQLSNLFLIKNNSGRAISIVIKSGSTDYGTIILRSGQKQVVKLPKRVSVKPGIHSFSLAISRRGVRGSKRIDLNVNVRRNSDVGRVYYILDKNLGVTQYINSRELFQKVEPLKGSGVQVQYGHLENTGFGFDGLREFIRENTTLGVSKTDLKGLSALMYNLEGLSKGRKSKSVAIVVISCRTFLNLQQKINANKKKNKRVNQYEEKVLKGWRDSLKTASKLKRIHFIVFKDNKQKVPEVWTRFCESRVNGKKIVSSHTVDNSSREIQRVSDFHRIMAKILHKLY